VRRLLGPGRVRMQHVKFPLVPGENWTDEEKARWADVKAFADEWPHEGWSPPETLCYDFSAVWGFGVFGITSVLAFWQMAHFGISTLTLYTALALVLAGGIACMWISYRFQNPALLPKGPGVPIGVAMERKRQGLHWDPRVDAAAVADATEPIAPVRHLSVVQTDDVEDEILVAAQEPIR
jgi:hypothetical protein